MVNAVQGRKGGMVWVGKSARVCARSTAQVEEEARKSWVGEDVREYVDIASTKHVQKGWWEHWWGSLRQCLVTFPAGFPTEPLEKSAEKIANVNCYRKALVTGCKCVLQLVAKLPDCNLCMLGQPEF